MSIQLRKSLVSVSALVVMVAAAITWFAVHPGDAKAGRENGGTVSARLGGVEGIRSFLAVKAVPAILADPELAPFFAVLTETPGDIEDCLARLLDHDLGGMSAKNGTSTETGHICRSSMSNVHRGLAINDHAFDRFIEIVGREALAAGVAPADVQEVAKRLETYRGSIVRQ
jgi:hypothetical protein